MRLLLSTLPLAATPTVRAQDVPTPRREAAAAAEADVKAAVLAQ